MLKAQQLKTKTYKLSSFFNSKIITSYISMIFWPLNWRKCLCFYFINLATFILHPYSDIFYETVYNKSQDFIL